MFYRESISELSYSTHCNSKTEIIIAFASNLTCESISFWIKQNIPIHYIIIFIYCYIYLSRLKIEDNPL